MRKLIRRSISILLTLIMLICLIPTNNLIALNLIINAKADDCLYDISSLPNEIPLYPQDGQKYWVLFNEGLRSDRFEMSTFDVEGDNSNVKIIWNKSLTAISTSGTVTRSNQFHYTSSEWIFDRTYGVLSDSATSVFASNVDIYDENENLIVAATEWNDICYDGENKIKYLEDLIPVNSDKYTGNQGDSQIGPYGTRNTSVGSSGETVSGNFYDHGLEVWIARFNGEEEKSWVWNEYALNSQYKTLKGYLDNRHYSYDDWDYTLYDHTTTIEIIGDGEILFSQKVDNLTSFPININIDISDVNILRIYAYDNVASAVGNSFILGDMILTEQAQDEQTQEIFLEKKYIADIWLNRAGKDFESAESYLLNNTFLYPGFESMSSAMTESLENNDAFNAAVTAWNGMSVVFTPEDISKNFVLEKQDLYDSVVIDMISYVLNDELFLANLESRALEASKTVNDILGVPVKIADTVYEIEDVPKLKEMKQTDPETWSKYTKLQYENLTKSGVNIGTLSDCSSALGFLLEYAENGLDFIKSVSAYQMVGELEASLQNALYAIKSKSSSLLLRASIEKITYLSIEDKTELSYSVAASEFTVNMVETIASEIASAALSAYPIYGQLKAVYEVGSTFCNLVLSTQNIIDKAQLIAAASELYSSAKASAVDLKNKYISSDSYNDASSFIASVELLMSALVIDMNCALEFVKAATEDGLINKAKKIPNAVMSLFGKGEATTYEQLCQSVEYITNNLSQNIDFMKTNWIMDSNYLRADYPDVFPVYARDEITKIKYNPVLTDAYLDNNGKSHIIYNDLSYNDGVQVKESVNETEKLYEHDYGTDFENYSNNITCYNEETINIFPKMYSLKSYVNSTAGKIYSNESNQMTLNNPLKSAYVDIMFNRLDTSLINSVNNVFVIKDTTSDYYENITYSIYRKSPNSDYAKIDEIKRGENLINGYTTYRDETVESGMIYTYMISSVLTLDNGITINADGEKTFTVKTSDLPGDRFDITVEFVNNGRRSVATRAAAALTRSSTPEDNSGIFLKWQSDTEADSYEIYRKPAFSEEYKLIGTAGSECEYFDTSAADGLSYDYIIAAYMTDNGEQIYLGSSNSVSYTNYRLLLSGESTVEQGKTVQLSAETSPVSDEAITWTVDNSGVASVDENGVVTGLSQGTATVTATTFNGISESYLITVTNSEDLEEPTTETEQPTTKPNETTTEKPTEPKPAYTLGDIDGNGKITAADARLALRISAKLETGTETQLLAADTDKNGRITASDARKILRVAANLEIFSENTVQHTTLPSVHTTEPVLETTTKPVVESTTLVHETTTEFIEEPTTEPATETESNVEEGKSDYPEIIDSFLNKKYYIDCVIKSSENDEQPLKFAVNGESIELVESFMNKSISIYKENENIYVKWIYDNTKWYIDSKSLEKYLESGAFTMVFDSLDFLPNYEFGVPTLTYEIVDEINYDVYTFSKNSSEKILFYILDDNLIKIQILDDAGVTEISVNEITEEIPEGMLTLSGYKKGSLLLFNQSFL